MRKLLLALVLLLAPLVAFGQSVSPWKLQGNALQPAHITDRKPIAVIYDDINLVGSGYNAQQVLAENQNVGRLWKTLKEQGQEVHFYNASYFSDNTGLYLWQHLGTQYAVALCMGFDATYGTSGTTAYRKFFCPDSTTAQIVHWSMADRVRDVYGGSPQYYLGTGVHNLSPSNYLNNAYASNGDSTHSAFTTPSGDSLFAGRFLSSRAVYAYPNLPWPRNVPVATINGTSAGGQIIATSGGGFLGVRAELMLHGRVTWPGAAGPIWVTSVAESLTLNRVNIGQHGFVGGSRDSLNAQFPTNGVHDFTFWGTDSTNYRISNVVQLFRPTWNAQDSVKVVMTDGMCRLDSSASMYADTVATRAMEMVPIAWRTYWQTQRGRTPSWPNATDTLSRRWVDYVLMTVSVQGATWPSVVDNTGPQLLSVVSRYALVDPQLFAYEWDDFAPFNYDKQDSSGLTYSYRWPEPDTIASFVNNLRRYGVNSIVTTGPGDSLYAQMAVPQGGWNESVTARRALKYAGLLGWVNGFSAHTHDSLSTNRLGIVAGVGPSYAGGAIAYPRTAFADGSALGGSGATFTYGTGSELVIGNQLKWGISQRFAMHDSAYRANFGSDVIIPYTSYPGDNSVPGNVVLSKWAGVGSVPRYKYSDSRGTGSQPWVLCPPESLYLAHAYNNKKYVRGYVVLGNPFGFTSGEGSVTLYRTPATMPATDTTAGFVPNRYFNFPDERFYGKMPSSGAPYYAPYQYADADNGRYFIRCIGTIGLYPINALKGTKPNSIRNPARSCYIRSITGVDLPIVLGVANPVPRPYQPQSALGETAQGATAFFVNSRNIDVGKVRMIYQHPERTQIMYGTLWGNRNWEWETMRVVVLDPLKALNGIAGHDQIKWVKPWQVYDK